MKNIIIIILMMLFSYLLGSISSAILIYKILYSTDPRNYGSKNPGASNILRISGYKPAIYVMFFDSLKGAIPIWVGLFFKIPLIYLNIIAIMSAIGHMYPIFFQFKGGKGVATTFGALTAINFHLSIIMIGTWILIVLLFRYASLGSIVTAVVISLYTWFFKYQYFFFTISLSFLIIIKHTTNIKRLWKGEEKHIMRR